MGLWGAGGGGLRRGEGKSVKEVFWTLRRERERERDEQTHAEKNITRWTREVKKKQWEQQQAEEQQEQ